MRRGFPQQRCLLAHPLPSGAQMAVQEGKSRSAFPRKSRHAIEVLRRERGIAVDSPVILLRQDQLRKQGGKSRPAPTRIPEPEQRSSWRSRRIRCRQACCWRSVVSATEYLIGRTGGGRVPIYLLHSSSSCSTPERDGSSTAIRHRTVYFRESSRAGARRRLSSAANAASCAGRRGTSRDSRPAPRNRA